MTAQYARKIDSHSLVFHVVAGPEGVPHALCRKSILLSDDVWTAEQITESYYGSRCRACVKRLNSPTPAPTASAAGKITVAALAARVEAGKSVRVLFDRQDPEWAAQCGHEPKLIPATRKTGVETLTVTGVEVSTYRAPGARASRQYIFTTSQGPSGKLIPNQTFILAPEDAPAVKRAHAKALEIERKRNDRAFLKAVTTLATSPEVRAKAADLLAVTEPVMVAPVTSKPTPAPMPVPTVDEVVRMTGDPVGWLADLLGECQPCPVSGGMRARCTYGFGHPGPCSWVLSVDQAHAEALAVIAADLAACTSADDAALTRAAIVDRAGRRLTHLLNADTRP